MRKLMSVLAVLAVATTTMEAGADDSAVLDRDMRTFLQWFPGVYDNQEQVYFEVEQGVPEEERHERIHHTFARVELPAFGEHVFYVQQYLDDDPQKIYRQRIYVFTPDYEENSIRLAIHTPNDVEALVDAHLDSSKLEGLTPELARNMPGCDVWWQKQANQFLGYMRAGECSFVSKRSGKRIIIDDDLVLTEDEIWISDRAEDEDGNYVFGNKAGIHHKNIKARRFECWIAAQERNGDDWTFRSGLEVWDQGGTIWIDTEEDKPQTVGIKLRNVRWPTGINRNSFVMYAHREGEERAVSYVWGEPAATRLAMNLRWMQASCTHSPLP
ncbi:MAG: chromophore lyase CpcT/CpeT [Gammaproteobacteria bacterium]|nr:chromophore lyase CpcT/CpeT [Gammaproteobacteria bacterium]